MHLHLLRTLALALESRLQMCETSAPFFFRVLSFRFCQIFGLVLSAPQLQKDQKDRRKMPSPALQLLAAGPRPKLGLHFVAQPCSFPTAQLRNTAQKARSSQLSGINRRILSVDSGPFAARKDLGQSSPGCFSTGFGSWSRGCLFSAALGDHRALQSGQEPSPNCTRQAQGLLAKDCVFEKRGEARLDWEAGPWLAAGMVLVVLVYTLSKARPPGKGLFAWLLGFSGRKGLTGATTHHYQ